MRIKNFGALVLALAMLFAGIGQTEAQELKERVEVRKAATSTRGAIKGEENREKRVEKQREIASRKIEHLERVMSATIERLEKIAGRIESRIEKLKERGGNTADAEAHLSMARADLASARASLSTFISIDISSDMAQDNFQRVRSAVAETREYIRSAHKHLSLSTNSLSGVRAEIERYQPSEAE